MWAVEHFADSFAMLRECDDRSVDHVMTDPPYDAHCQANQMSGSTLAKVDLKFAALTNRSFVKDCVRVAKRWALVFCTIEDLGLFRLAVGGARADGGAWIRGGVWYKPNSMGQLSGDRPAAAYEAFGIMSETEPEDDNQALAVLHRSGDRTRWNGRGGFAIWKCSGTRGEKGRHPSQKPLKLLCDMIHKFTEPEETIFDPFCGSGRIGEAAILMGRNYIGGDNDPEWVERARARCLQVEGRFGEYAATWNPRSCAMKDHAS